MRFFEPLTITVEYILHFYGFGDRFLSRKFIINDNYNQNVLYIINMSSLIYNHLMNRHFLIFIY